MQQSLGNKSQPSADENFKELTLAQAGCLLSWWEPRDKSPIGILRFVSTAVLLHATWEHGLLSRKWLGKVEISPSPPTPPHPTPAYLIYLFIYKSRAVNQLEPLWCFMIQLFWINRPHQGMSQKGVSLKSACTPSQRCTMVGAVCPKHCLPGHPE